MAKMTDKFLKWCAEDTPAARFERSIAQGIIAVLVSGLATGEWGVATVTALIMAVVSPIQAAIGGKDA